MNDNAMRAAAPAGGVPEGYVLVPIETVLAQSPRRRPRAPVLKDFVERFLAEKSSLSYLTLRGYRGDLRRSILPALGDIPIDRIGHSEIQMMIDSCSTKKTSQTAKSTLSSILGYAVALGLLDHNPAIGTYIFKAEIKPETPALGEWLTDWDQIAAILSAAREYDPGGEIERACLVGFGFGARKGEILGADSEDFIFDEQGARFHIRSSFTRWRNGPKMHALKTAHSDRVVPMLGYVAKRIQEIDPDPGAFVTFGGSRSNPASIPKRIQRFRKELGLPNFTLASMRPSFATAALRSGMNIKDVQLWLGHTTELTTLRYTRPDPSALVEDAKVLSANLDRALRGEPIPLEGHLGGRELERAVGECLETDVGDRLAAAPNLAPKTAPNLAPKRRDSREDAVLALITERPEISNAELAEALGVSLRTMKRTTASMREKQVIEHVGPARGGHWRILPQK